LQETKTYPELGNARFPLVSLATAENVHDAPVQGSLSQRSMVQEELRIA
jgi:hypothetical protein